jgi:hypothetical protein
MPISENEKNGKNFDMYLREIDFVDGRCVEPAQNRVKWAGCGIMDVILSGCATRRWVN